MKKLKKLLSAALAMTMALSLTVPSAFAADPVTPKAAFTSPEGTAIISLAESKKYTVTVPLEAGTALTQEQLDSITLSLDWDEALTTEKYLDPEMYPNHLDGGDITDTTAWPEINFASGWNAPDDYKPFFFGMTSDINTEGNLEVVFENNCYWGTDPSAPHSSGGAYLDVCGYFDLTVKMGDKELGNVQDILIAPYDNFNTMQEIYAELDEMVTFAKDKTDLYVEKLSMGTSSGKIYAPLDMPYLLIADDASTVSDWLAFTEKAESDPTAVIADIKAGKYDELKVPVMFSNIHANEVAAADGIMAFTWMLLESAAAGADMTYDKLTGFTADGQTQLANEMQDKGIVIPDLVKDTATYLGYITDGNMVDGWYGPEPASGKVELDKYYTSSNVSVDVDALLDKVFFILVPEENVEGRTYITRTASNGYDLNRDNSFQTTPETQNMQKLIGTFNPVSLMEFHGRVEGFQVEPCSPPHEPNFEYDLLSNFLLTAGESFGIAAVANNNGYNSYVMPMRDYLYDNGDGTASWYVWDDMSTSYTPQFAMLHGSLAYTVELPAYNDDTVAAVQYGSLGLSDFIADNKTAILTNQVSIFERGVKNANSNDKVNIWLSDQNDVEGAEADLWRPVFDGEGENGNFYPEFYIIPLDAENQSNLDAAYDMMAWLSRNDVEILVTEEAYTFDGVTYPAGTMIISMYQAKRSVANGALYDGTFITTWSELYSEGITSFAQTRGFDMVTVAKAGEIDKLSCSAAMDYDDCLSYIAENKKTSFSGTKNADVIISNASEASTAAVNALLQAGKVVGMIDDADSPFYGDFICKYDDYLTVADKYTLTATGIASHESSYPSAKVITKAPTVYVTGASATNKSGFLYSSQVSNANWNYDMAALEMMNFSVTADPTAADAIIGASALKDDAKAAVLAGTPYVGYGSSALRNFDIVTLSRKSLGGMDCLAYVTYGDKNLINGSYITEGDNIMYGYGAGFFSAIPEGASVLVKMDGSKEPTEGFIPKTDNNAADFDAFMNGGILGFTYAGKAADGTSDIDIAFFANSLTHKLHQRDEYAYISNFVFSHLLGDAYVAAKVAPPTGDGFNAALWIGMMGLTALAATVLFTKKKAN